MSKNKLIIGRYFDLEVDLDNQELIILGRGDSSLYIRVPISYMGGFAKVKTKAERPELVDIIKRKVIK